jgi:hypothetical protein
MKLGALPAPLRSIVRDESHGGMLIEAELPWLTVGSEIQAEFPDGREKAGRVHWFGVDATSAGSARLRIFVDLSSAGEGVPVRLPDLAELAGTRARRWPWALATGILMMATAVVVYTLARRPAQPAALPSPVVAQPAAAPQRTPDPPTVPKESPASPAPTSPQLAQRAKDTSPSAATPHAKPKRKRR